MLCKLEHLFVSTNGTQMETTSARRSVEDGDKSYFRTMYIDLTTCLSIAILEVFGHLPHNLQQ